MFAPIGRAIGPTLLVLACLGLSACEATYDDTKGWANRLEASFLKEMERTFQQPEPKPMRQQSDPGWEAADAAKGRQASPASGVVAETAAKMVGTTQGEDAKNAEAAAPMKMSDTLAQPKAAGSLSDDPTGPTATVPAGETDTSNQGAKEMDPTGPVMAEAKAQEPPLPQPKPSGEAKKKSGAAAQNAPAKTALVIHLSSLRSEAAAKKEWQALQKAFPDQLAAMSPRFRRTEIAKRGTFYRVLAGPLTSKQAARQICSALKAKKQYCQVMTAPPSA